MAKPRTNGFAKRFNRTGTVKVHVERVFQKLDVENRTAASRLAIERLAALGLLPDGEPSSSGSER